MHCSRPRLICFSMATRSPSDVAFVSAIAIHRHLRQSCSSDLRGKGLCVAIARSESDANSVSNLSRQRLSLESGTWVKLICGASSHDLPRIRNLALLSSLLSLDCVDAAADHAVVAAVRDGFRGAAVMREFGAEFRVPRIIDSKQTDPLLMISVNDDEDPHFRKAVFNANACPPACPRPCERVCPANAIDFTGVLQDICYGCGRCIPVCPQGIVSASSYVHTPTSICSLISEVDALEIHTQGRGFAEFERLWDSIGETVRGSLQLIAVSFPDLGTDQELGNGLLSMWNILSNIPSHMQLVWQTDGRPMSGDIGRGTAKAAVDLAARVRRLLTELEIPGHVQVAGGTNDATVPLLRKEGLLRSSSRVAGVAYGGYLRKIVGKHLDRLEQRAITKIEDDKEILHSALQEMVTLLQEIKHNELQLGSKSLS